MTIDSLHEAIDDLEQRGIELTPGQQKELLFNFRNLIKGKDELQADLAAKDRRIAELEAKLATARLHYSIDSGSPEAEARDRLAVIGFADVERRLATAERERDALAVENGELQRATEHPELYRCIHETLKAARKAGGENEARAIALGASANIAARLSGLKVEPQRAEVDKESARKMAQQLDAAIDAARGTHDDQHVTEKANKPLDTN